MKPPSGFILRAMARRPLSLPPSPLPRCDVSLCEFTAAVRDQLSLSSPTGSEAETIATLVAQPPAIVEGTDAVAWLAWTLSGLPLFTEADLPPLRTATERVRRLLTVLAVARNNGNFTHAAEILGTSRRLIRDTLERSDLYPWPGLGPQP